MPAKRSTHAGRSPIDEANGEVVVDVDLLDATAAEPRHYADEVCECFIRRSRMPFDLPDQLVESCLAGHLVVFAGAGVSTENRAVLPFTLHEEVCAELGLDVEERVPFPRAMSMYEAEFGRPALLTRIRTRLDHVASFEELNGLACRFHRELSTLFLVRDIFTTNWDQYFERECGATSYLTEANWAFWRYGGRKVFKLHGSMSSPGSIVATEEDYKRCYRRLSRGILGATLKTMLATKTVVFIGYSFGDSDFNAIYSALSRQMGAVMPTAYLVSPEAGERSSVTKNVGVIQTDGTYFVEKLKAMLPREEFIEDVRLAAIPLMAAYVRHLHSQLLRERPFHEYPETIYAAAYQDGLLHAFDHQRTNRPSGIYSHRCNVANWIDMYARYRANALRAKHYWDVAYIEGYIAGLRALLTESPRDTPFPAFYVFGFTDPLENFDAYIAAADNAASLHKTAYRDAARLAKRFGDG